MMATGSVSRLDAVFEMFSAWNIVNILLIYLVYRVLRALYNVSPLHPLSSVPGPKFAAMTRAYECYYDMILWGRYGREIKKMHETYGPIVRINPFELHCNDPGFIDEIFAGGGRKRDKPRHQLAGVVGANTVAFFGTAEHSHHRLRRGAVNKFFSKAQISRLEPEIHALAQKLCDNLLREAGKDPVEVAGAYSCYASDIISDYCFGEAFGFLQQPSFEPNFRKATYSFLSSWHIFKYFPFLKSLVLAAPLFTSYLPEDSALLFDTFFVNIPNRIKKIQVDREAGVTVKRNTIFASLLESDLPPEEKTLYRLTGEGTAFLGAGTETTSWALAVLTFYLLRNPDVLRRLTTELQSAVPDPRNLPSWSALEKLPYLSSVILEGLRLSYGVSERISRVAPEEDLVYSGSWTPPGRKDPVEVRYIIPRGTPIGMSSAVLHHNEEIFPHSDRFDPDRWLDEKGQRRKELEKCLFSFSRGSRQCVGINLANCELHVGLAALVLRVLPNMELFETSEDAVKYDHDLFMPMPKKGSRGVLIKIH